MPEAAWSLKALERSLYPEAPQDGSGGAEVFLGPKLLHTARITHQAISMKSHVLLPAKLPGKNHPAAWILTPQRPTHHCHRTGCKHKWPAAALSPSVTSLSLLPLSPAVGHDTPCSNSTNRYVSAREILWPFQHLCAHGRIKTNQPTAK